LVRIPYLYSLSSLAKPQASSGNVAAYLLVHPLTDVLVGH